MAEKSEITAMPIINANEASYQDCVKILDTYTHWIVEIFTKANKLPAGSLPEPQNLPIPEDAETRPGQPEAHQFHPEENMDLKMCTSGDQLTSQRFRGTKTLRKGAHTPQERMEFCSPFGPVMWHTKASLLQYAYHILFESSSVHEIGTLKNFREKYNRRNVTPTKVLDSYDGCEELFLSTGKVNLFSCVHTGSIFVRQG